MTLRFAIKVPVPTDAKKESWGDYHFAASLSQGLSKLGATTRIDCRDAWKQNRQHDEIELFIRGKEPLVDNGPNLKLVWLISWPETWKKGELALADHVFLASQPLVDLVAKSVPKVAQSLLPQAFDAAVMAPVDISIPVKGVSFVGIGRPEYKRPSVEFALQKEIDIDLYGKFWEKSPARKYLRSTYLANENLGDLYARSEVVLNDHMPMMKKYGLASNRIFDVLACGRPVVSDQVSWLPADMIPFVYRYHDADSFSKAVDKARNESKALRQKRIKFADHMRQNHSFDARAKTIMNTTKQILSTRATKG